MSVTVDQVAAVAAQVLARGPQGITAESRLAEDLGLDSTDKLELEMACEDAFAFRFADDQDGFHACETIGDVHQAVTKAQTKNKELTNL